MGGVVVVDVPEDEDEELPDDDPLDEEPLDDDDEPPDEELLDEEPEDEEPLPEDPDEVDPPEDAGPFNTGPTAGGAGSGVLTESLLLVGAVIPPQPMTSAAAIKATISGCFKFHPFISHAMKDTTHETAAATPASFHRHC